jgi:hypothetical protein
MSTTGSTSNPNEPKKEPGFIEGLFKGSDEKEKEKEKEKEVSNNDAAATTETNIEQGDKGNEAEKDNEGGIMSFFSSKDENTADASKEQAPKEEAPKEESKGILSALGFGNKEEEKSEPVDSTAIPSSTAPPPVEEAKAEKKEDDSLIGKVSKMFESKPAEDAGVTADASKSDEDVSTEEEEDVSTEEDEDVSTEEEEDDVEIFLTKIKTLRSRCKKMKEKYRVLREKYNEVKSKNSFNIGEGSVFTKMVASLMAIEGATKQHKLYIKELAKKNKISIDGLDTNDENSGSENEDMTPSFLQSRPELNSSSSDSEDNSANEEEVREEEKEERGSSALAPVTIKSDNMGIDLNNTEDRETMNNSESLPSGDNNLSNSMVQASEENEQTRVQPPAAIPAAIPATPATPATPAIPAATPPAAPNLVSGGRSHFVTKNHIKTQRHHKRRKRHQSLKNMARPS